MKVEVRELEYLKQKRLMLQVIDVTDSIRYDQSKEQNQMLSILNATVSHELRNPRNAITGQNVQKEGLYATLSAAIEGLRSGSLAPAVAAGLRLSLPVQGVTPTVTVKFLRCKAEYNSDFDETSVMA